MTEENSMNVGVQPLDAIMNELGISNHDLVVVMQPGYITHKQVQKARKGRRLTPKLQDKVLTALNAYVDEGDYVIKDLFTYRGKKAL
jgi:hypothetical protein